MFKIRLYMIWLLRGVKLQLFLKQRWEYIMLPVSLWSYLSLYTGETNDRQAFNTMKKITWSGASNYIFIVHPSDPEQD